MSDAPPAYLALDLWMALGLDSNLFDGYYDRNGWANTWANLLHHVRLSTSEPCSGVDDQGDQCVLTEHAIGPHYSEHDVGSSEPLPFS